MVSGDGGGLLPGWWRVLLHELLPLLHALFAHQLHRVEATRSQDQIGDHEANTDQWDSEDTTDDLGDFQNVSLLVFSVD